MIPLRWLLGADLHFLGNIGSSTINKNCGYNSRVSNARHSWARSRLRGDHPLVSPEPVSGPRGSAEGLKDYFRIADDPLRTGYESQCEKTAPCGESDPFQPCGDPRSAKLKPGFPSAS